MENTGQLQLQFQSDATLKEVGDEFADPRDQPRFRLGIREGWLTFFILLFLLFCVVWSVQAADWVDDLPSIIVVALLGALAGLGVSKIRFNGIPLFLSGLVLAYIMILWQTWSLTTDEWVFGKTEDVVDRFRIWVTAAQEGGISADPLPFVIIIVTLAWLLSFYSAWFVFRGLGLWPVIIPTAIALSLNLLYLPREFWIWFYLYILAALLLAMRLHLVKRQLNWHKDKMPYFKKAHSSFLMAAAVLGSLVIVVTWALPGVDFSVSYLRKNWATMSTPWKSMETEMGRVLSFLPAKKPFTIYRFGEAFPFRGASKLGEHVALTVQSNRPEYWKAETFDVYTSKGWLSGDRADLVGSLVPEDAALTYTSTNRVDQSVSLGVGTDSIYTGGVPLYSTVGFKLEVVPPMSFTIDLNDSSTDELLPQDLQDLAGSFREEAQQGTLTFTEEGSLQLLPKDTEIIDIVLDGNRVTKIEVARLPPNPPDITAMRPVRDLDPRDSYRAVSYTSAATEAMLRFAGTDYPSWVTDRYLQLPDELPDRVKRLSIGLTPDSHYETPYDKAVQIEAWLRKQMFYTTEIEPVPKESDGIDHFLFTTKRGYSSYYGSAMTVMLRAIGIPARLAVGYSTGEWDQAQEAYVVRSANAHAWPEVYFPTFGWIPFEPVPVYGLIVRGGVIEDRFFVDTSGGGQGGPIRNQPALQGADPPVLPRGEEVANETSTFVWLVPVVLSGVLIVVAGVWYWYNRGLFRLGYPARLYGKMGRLAAIGGYGPRPYQTPIEYGDALATEMDVIEGHVERITEAYAHNKYRSPGSHAFMKKLSRPIDPAEDPEAIQEVAVDDKETLREAWRSLRRPLLLWSMKKKLFFWRTGW